MPRARVARRSPSLPLGSLTQPGARTEAACSECGSDRVTAIDMNLGDGSRVQFTSCHRCEHRGLTEAGQALGVDGVLDRARKR